MRGGGAVRLSFCSMKLPPTVGDLRLVSNMFVSRPGWGIFGAGLNHISPLVVEGIHTRV